MNSDNASFPLTDWLLIDAIIAASTSKTRRVSLDELLRRYVPAMRRFVRARFRTDQHVADDWVQEFVLSAILHKDLLARVDRERGRFRTFLSCALSNIVVDELRRANGRRRTLVKFAASQLRSGAHHDSNPATFLDRAWAEEVLAEALARTKQCLESTHRCKAWHVFVRRTNYWSDQPNETRSIRAELGFDTPTQVASAYRGAKRVFSRTLTTVLLESDCRGEDLPAAILELRSILSRGR